MSQTKHPGTDNSEKSGRSRLGVKLFKSVARILLVVLVFVCGAWFFLAQPTCRENGSSPVSAAPDRLKTHVKKLSVDLSPRSYRNIENLNAAAAYIKGHFEKAGATAQYQSYKVGPKNNYKNVIGRFEGDSERRLIIGAHYDAYADLPGADDNASAVSGLIELAYLLGKQTDNLPVDVELVAYTLEEPPYFRTSKMGSCVHAKSVTSEKDNIAGVIVLEMIGYFSDRPGSQSHPAPLMKMFYPSRGNFIAVVGNMKHRQLTKTVKSLMSGATDLPVYSINAPAQLPGIDFSDHASYWPHGIRAIMITDTAFYRNEAYHTKNDTWDRLDYDKMAAVVVGLYEVVMGW